jgi:hypothetical protein
MSMKAFFGGFACYDPHRHEFDPILQAWIYGGPRTPTFWEERNRELAEDWCEYKGITREQGIAEMEAWQEQQKGKEHRAVFVNANGEEIDILRDILGQGEDAPSGNSSDDDLDPAFLKMLKDMNLR